MVVEDGDGEQAIERVVARCDPRLRGTLAALQARRLAAPIAYEIAARRSSSSGPTARLALNDRDLRLMERLARAQVRKAGGADEGAVEEIKRIELDTAWGFERTGISEWSDPGRRPRSRPRIARRHQSQAAEQFAQLLARIGLGQVGVHAGRLGLRRVLVEGVGRQRDDRQSARRRCRFSLADLARRS